jgi:Domain of unknown function (DUF4345)
MKRLLQIVTVVLVLIPIVTGIIAMSGTSDPIYAAASVAPLPVLDSNLRFFAGVWLDSPFSGLFRKSIPRPCCFAPYGS